MRIRRWLWGLTLALVTAAVVFALRRYVWLAPNPTLSWTYHGVVYELLSPRTLAVTLLLPVLLYAIGRSLADLPWPQRILSLGLRFAFLAMLAVALGRLSRTSTTSKVCTVYVVDVSDSVPPEALPDAQAEVQKAIDAKPVDDQVKVITFARRPRTVDLAADGKQAPAITRHEGAGLNAGSNVQAAMQLAYGLFPPGYLKRVVLISDGLQTDGDALAEAGRAKQFGVRVSTVAPRRPVPGEVAVRELKLPARVKVGEAFEIHADVYASRATTARARLFQGEALNGLEGVRKLELKAGTNDVVFKSIVRVAGEVTYALELDELADDKFKENNRIATTVDVPGKPTILLVDNTPAQASYLASALTAQQYDVDTRPPSAFPGSLKELERYDFVILSDTPAERFGLDAQGLVEAYVRDLGGGFLFAGGENGYSLGGWANSTIERILPVRMDGKKENETPSVALSLVIDRSGSMTGQPMEMAKAAAKAAVDVLQPSDLVEVIAFDSQPTRYVKVMSAKRKGKIDNDIARIQPGGGTEILPALDAAFQDLSVVQARKKHVILLTDGKAPTAGIRDVVQAMAAEAITVTTVGLGADVDDGLLTMIKDVGGGRFHKVPDPASLPKIFTTETEVVSRQAAQEDWFQVHQTGPAGFLAGVDLGGAPYLHGYVSTRMKPTPAQEILVAPTGEPILARLRVGTGWTLAWTSDIKNRWSVEWLRWGGFGQFFGQLAREHMRVKHRREFDLHTDVQGGEVHAFVDAFTGDERFENGLDSVIQVLGPMPSQDKRDLPMRQTAPGRYESSFTLDKYGSFLLRAEHRRLTDDGKKSAVAVSYGHINNPYPAEFSRFEPDLATLARIAESTGGRVDPTPPQVFDPQGEKIEYHEALWPRVVMAAIVVFLLDLFLRRVRIFDRKVLPPTRRVALNRVYLGTWSARWAALGGRALGRPPPTPPSLRSGGDHRRTSVSVGRPAGRCRKPDAARRSPHAARRSPLAARRTPHAARRWRPARSAPDWRRGSPVVPS